MLGLHALSETLKETRLLVACLESSSINDRLREGSESIVVGNLEELVVVGADDERRLPTLLNDIQNLNQVLKRSCRFPGLLVSLRIASQSLPEKIVEFVAAPY